MIQLTDYGYIPTTDEKTKFIPARVTAVHKERYELICEQGQCYGRLKTAEYYAAGELFPTTGDFILTEHFIGSDCRIVKTLPRKSFFSRLDPSSSGHAEQAVAANFDYVFIMQSLNHDLNLRRLERYITLAWQSGAVPLVVLTKADLLEDSSAQIRQVEIAAAGVDVFALSAKTGCGLDALSDYIKPRKTIVLLGSSGVGKSSLVNALAGEDIMAVSEIRKDDSKGRHTTTHRQLVMLKNGTMIIDTPGMRQLGMWDVSEGLVGAFADVEQHLGSCKFGDCRYLTEPGCAIRAALDSGELSPERWDSYQKLKSEATKRTGGRQAELARKQHWAKVIKNHKKEQAIKNKIR